MTEDFDERKARASTWFRDLRDGSSPPSRRSRTRRPPAPSPRPLRAGSSATETRAPAGGDGADAGGGLMA